MGKITSSSLTHETTPNYDAAPTNELAPVIVLGGLLTVSQLAWFYGPLLRLDKTSAAPANKRFVPPPQKGLGSVPDMEAELNDTLSRLYGIFGQRMHLVGHSLGGLFATRVTLGNPNIVASVTCIAGAQEGIKQETPASLALRYVLGNPHEAKLLKHDSEFMQDHTGRVATEWPENVPLHIISTVKDPLIVPPQGFGLHPRNQQAHKKLVVPKLGVARLPFLHIINNQPEDVEFMATHQPAGHASIVRASVVLRYISDNVQRQTIPDNVIAIQPNTYGHIDTAVAPAY